MVKYEVRQLISDINKRFMSVVYETTSARDGMLHFNEYKEKYKDEYFELIKIETIETCLNWTSEKERLKRVSQTT